MKMITANVHPARFADCRFSWCVIGAAKTDKGILPATVVRRSRGLKPFVSTNDPSACIGVILRHLKHSLSLLREKLHLLACPLLVSCGRLRNGFGAGNLLSKVGGNYCFFVATGKPRSISLV